ncbi:DUF72 domain-containing protein [candidate division NPL-UPA2 bacterium]|nr:DUF72 domain-containing protein [candidate division NPL-UPA2 bacterium]
MIKIGTSGFSFEDWKGVVYPENITKRNMLPYYEKELGFDTLEVNFTYYRLPSTNTMLGMMRRTSKDFDFVVKSHREMTHEIWADSRRKQLKDTSEVFSKFVYGLRPLIDEGRLGCVLLQFPSFFWPNKPNTDYILACRDMLDNIPVVVEFRNKAWVKEDTFNFLIESNLGFCCPDEPPLPELMPFTPRATSDIGYFRFHGRNMNWFKASVSERYNYLYSEDELKEFVPRVKEVAGRTVKTYNFFNNCHAGAAARNAQMMKNLMGMGKKPERRQGELF